MKKILKPTWKPFVSSRRHAAGVLLGALLIACGSRAHEPLKPWPRPSWEPGGKTAMSIPR
jgi:hypothetical protein